VLHKHFKVLQQHASKRYIQPPREAARAHTYRFGRVDPTVVNAEGGTQHIGANLQHTQLRRKQHAQLRRKLGFVEQLQRHAAAPLTFPTQF